MIALNTKKMPGTVEKIKVIAVGNAGINLLDRIFLETGGAIDCAAINTDSTSLNASMAPEKILLGEKIMRGLGAAGDPELGRQAVEENHDALVGLMGEIDGAVLLGGLGGGTAGEVLVELQKLARELNKPVFHMVTLPFGFEGPRRLRQANECLHVLRQRGGIVAVFPNERLGEVSSSAGPIGEAFGACDRILETAVGAFLEVLHGRGPWETSACELAALLGDPDPDCGTFFSTAAAKSGTRAHDVVPRLFKSPLAKAGLPPADVRCVHIHLSSGSGLSLAEIRTTVDLIRREFEDETQFHIGVSTDRREPQELAVTIFGSSRKPLVMERGAATAVAAPPVSPAPAVLPAREISARQEIVPEPAQPAEDDSSAKAPTLENDSVPAEKGSAMPAAATDALHPDDTPPSPIEAGEAADAPPDLLPGMESVPSKPRPPVAPTKKSPSKPKQEVLPLDVASRGRFERSEPTIEEGEDLDIPTFIRLKIRLK